MGGGIFGTLLGGNGSSLSAVQNQATNAQTSAQQQMQGLAAQQNVANQQQLGNQQGISSSGQAGSILVYNGQTPQWVQPSAHVPKGQAYQITYNGQTQTLVHPQALTPDALEQMKAEWLAKKKDQFLKHPVVNREAFLNDLRAREVAKDMDDSGLFGVQRQGYQQWANQGQAGGLQAWIPPQLQTEITLDMYENWHADSLIDSVLESAE